MSQNKKIIAQLTYKLRGDTLENWENLNPILATREPALVINETGQTIGFKVGDGHTAWIDLKYHNLDLNEIGVGRPTEQNGAIFNDYDNNQAIAPNTIASGTHTQAGGKAFTIVEQATDVSWGSDEGWFKLSEDSTLALEELKASLTDDEGNFNTGCWYSLYFRDSGVAGINYGNFDYQGTIEYIDPSEQKVYITNYIPNCSITEDSQFRVPAFPNIGTEIIGTASQATGYATQAVNIAANSEGYGTVASGKYSHSQNLNTIAGGYAADAGGWNTKALGKGSVTRGKDTQALIDFSDAGGKGTKTTANRSKFAQFVRGLFNIGKDDTIMEIGNGDSDANRKNAFEVYRDGHAEVQKQGDTDNSVITKSGLTNLTKNYLRRGETKNGYNFNGVILSLDNNNDPTRGPKPYRSVVNGDNCGVRDGSVNSGAFGEWSVISENCPNSYVFGSALHSYRKNQFLVGSRNTKPATDDGAIFIVGDGGAVGYDRDAFKVYEDGSAFIRTVGGNKNSVVNKGYVDNLVGDIETALDELHNYAQSLIGGNE